MPSPHSYAHKVTASGRNDIPMVVVDALCQLFKKASFYAVVLERDENDRLHLHAGVIYLNGRTPCNVKSCYLGNKVIRQWYLANNTKICLQVARMWSQGWLTDYMSKDGPLYMSNLPGDLEDVSFAFLADKILKKHVNPEFHRWSRMYIDQEYVMPATESSVVCFFHKAMYVDDTLRICMDMRKLKDRCLAMVLYLNRAELLPTDLPYNGSGVLLGPRGISPALRNLLGFNGLGAYLPNGKVVEVVEVPEE